MRRLTLDDLANLKKIDNIRLLNILERWSDRKYLISIQNDNGVAHKDLSDPDVQKLHDDYNSIQKEVEKRLKSAGISALNINTLLNITNQIALDSAGRAGALGIPSPALSDSQLKQVKDGFNNIRGSIEFNLGN